MQVDGDVFTWSAHLDGGAISRLTPWARCGGSVEVSVRRSCRYMGTASGPVWPEHLLVLSNSDIYRFAYYVERSR